MIMYRVLLSFISLMFSALSFAQGNYQIDLILFAHPQNINELQNLPTPLIPIDKQAKILSSSLQKTEKLYTLLPPSQSSLRDEYYLLNRKSQFRVLAQYSWRQTAKQQSKIALPRTSNKGWLLQGTVQVNPKNNYTFNAEIQCSPPSNPSGAFTIKQNQHLVEGKTYYLDNPYVGMVVKIHRLN